jgi:hypothetical protein
MHGVGGIDLPAALLIAGLQQGAYIVVVGTKVLLLKSNMHELLDEMVSALGAPGAGQGWGELIIKGWAAGLV